MRPPAPWHERLQPRASEAATPWVSGCNPVCLRCARFMGVVRDGGDTLEQPAEAVGAEAVGAEAVGAEAVGAGAVGEEAVGAEAVGAEATGPAEVRPGAAAEAGGAGGAAGGEAADGAAETAAPSSGTAGAALRARCGPVWARHNAAVARAGAAGAHCSSLVPPPEAEAGRLSDSGAMAAGEVAGARKAGEREETPSCRGCGVALRPAVLMFGDDDPALLARLRARGDAYQRWEEQMEAAVSLQGRGGAGSGGGDSGGDGDGGRDADGGGASGGPCYLLVVITRTM